MSVMFQRESRSSKGGRHHRNPHGQTIQNLEPGSSTTQDGTDTDGCFLEIWPNIVYKPGDLNPRIRLRHFIQRLRRLATHYLQTDMGRLSDNAWPNLSKEVLHSFLIGMHVHTATE